MILQEKIKNIAEGFGKFAPLFLEGAKFALENQWISVKEDLPCNHEELMRTKNVCEGTETIEVFATSKGGLIWNDYMIYVNGKWRWNGNNFEPDYWMIAPKLPKEYKE